MRLLICTTEYPPWGSGIANVVYNMVNELKKRDVDCCVCSPIGPDIKIGNVKLIEKFGRLGLLYYWFKVRKILKNKSDFDLVWLHQPLMIRKSPFEKSVATIHITAKGVKNRTCINNKSNLARKIYKTFAAMLEKICIKKLQKNEVVFTAISNQVFEELKSLRIPENNISIIKNGVDTKKFRPVEKCFKQEYKKKFNIPKGDLIVLSVGNLTPTKNPLVLVETFSHIDGKKNVKLVIAGSGPLENELITKINENKLKNIIYLGHIDNKKIHHLYACSDVYVMSSLYEGLPLTLLEAMSSGLACIVSDVPSIKSMVNKAGAGVTIDFTNKLEAAESIEEFIDTDLEAYMKNARLFTKENLDWGLIADNYLELFRNVIGNN